MAYVVFSHGLDNKPSQDYLCALWKRKLAHDDGIDIDASGVASTLHYWADVLYPEPDANLAAYERTGEDFCGLDSPVDLRAIPFTGDDRVRRLALALGVDPEQLYDDQPTAEQIEAVRAERVPVPPWLRKRIMARLVRDAHHYFFNLEFSPRPGTTYRVRDELRRRFISCLESGANNRPLVVVSHSMGTIIAYDCLANEPTCPPIDGLMTIGSPLGLDEVQDFFPNWTRESGFPSSKLHGPWVNVYDPLDIVCGADPRLANDFRRGSDILIDDIRQDNWGYWRHSISKYLQGSELRHWLVRMLDIES